MQIAEIIVEYAKRLYDKGLLWGADGNISVRTGSIIYITPKGKHKGFLKAEEIAKVELSTGLVLEGQPSSEIAMHLEIYKQCTQAQCVIHAHPPTAIAWTIAEPSLKELQAEAMSEVILAVGSLPIVPFALPGSIEMGTNLLPYLPNHRAMILSRHGALSWGEDMDEAFKGMERIENSAQILKYAKELGGISILPIEDIQKLKALRAIIGEKSL